jgi:hypothetical protein
VTLLLSMSSLVCIFSRVCVGVVVYVCVCVFERVCQFVCCHVCLARLGAIWRPYIVESGVYQVLDIGHYNFVIFDCVRSDTYVCGGGCMYACVHL